MERIRVELGAGEYSALVRLCELELRGVNEQVRFLIVQELRRRALLAERQEAAPCTK